MEKTSLKKINSIFFTDVETSNTKRIIMEWSYFILNKFLAPKEQKCFIIKEVWENEEYRNGEFAIGKIEHWQEMLDNGTAKLISIYDLYWLINRTIEEQGIEFFSAFNLCFDFDAIEKTYHRFGIDKRKNYKEENKILQLKKFCIWKYAEKIYCTKEYIKWAEHNKKFTKTGKISSSAESIYQYLTENEFFTETHFGIEDLQVEYTILMASMYQNTINRNNSVIINKNGTWRTVENYRKSLEVA